MANYLHYAGDRFELPSEEAASELRTKINGIQRGTANNPQQIFVQLANGDVVYIWVQRGTSVAVSGSNAPETTKTADDVQIF